MWSTRVVVALIASLALPLPALPQTSSGSIAGTVLDPSQAAVPNAKVLVTEQEKKFTLTTTTDAEGRFVFPIVQPGRYTVAVEAPGFKKFERKELVLLGNEKLSVGSISLEVGTIAELVEVTAQPTQLQTESGERSASLVTQQMENIAVNSRSYLSLVNLTPGITTFPDLATAGHAGLGAISVNGARRNQNNLTLDGIGDVDTGNNGDQLATLSLDSVQEFRTLTSNYQAEYGRSSGAQISVVTKSGTGDFHGSGYLFHRHEGLNANNWKNNRDRLSRQLFRFNDAGYTIGGPIYIPGHFNKNRDKLFFFWSQEYQRQLRPQSRRDRTVPTLEERDGNFSKSVDKNGDPFPFIRDSRTGLPCNRSDRRGCFQDGEVLGRIPQDRRYGPGLKILSVYPPPNNIFDSSGRPNKGFNFTSQVSDSYPRREDLIRVDYNLSTKWKIFGHYINNLDSVTSAYGSFVLRSDLPKVPITDSRPGHHLTLSATTLINPTLTNEVTWGFGKNIINIDPVNDGLTRAKNGLSNLPMLFTSAIQQDFIPRFVFNGSRIANTDPGLGTNNAPFFNFNTTIEWIDNLSKVWNQHTFKTGIYLQRSRKDQTSFANANGDFDFGNDSSNPFDTGFGFGNAAIGTFRTFNQASQYATGRYRYWNIEFYLQDTYKLSRQLTLDYGIRFYWIQPQYDSALLTSTFLPERYDPQQAPALFRPGFDASGKRVAVNPLTGAIQPASFIGKIVPNTGNLLNGIAQAGKGVTKYLMENRGIHYSPRFGFAWDVAGRQNIVVRGGAGIVYDRFQGNIVFDEITNPPTTFSPNLVNGLVSQIDASSIVLAPSNLQVLSFAGKVPTTTNYSLGIQYQLPYGFMLDTSYVGSISRHLVDRRNLNAIPYGATFLPQNQDPTKNPNAPRGSRAFDRDFLRPFPGYADITANGMGSSSNYNSLQVSLNRRFTHGFFFGLAYTWGKILGTTALITSTTANTDDRNFVRIDNLTRFANYGPLSFDRRHTLAVNFIYDFPSLFRKNPVLHTIADGWQISGLYRYETGQPFGVGFSIPDVRNENLTGSYTEGARVRIMCDPLSGTSDDPFNRLNPNCFAPPLPGSRGLESGVNYLTAPGINNWDISLQKAFSFKERYSIQLRADAFNAFNHTQFSGINATINFSGVTNFIVTNRTLNPDGSINNKNGFGSVSGARDPRIVQLVVRFRF